ncbi:chromosomal replication initiator protein DnaA [Geobacter sulfurreducens]|uniref:Chromosomal replication initiator protein DnaA n=1 Tax=Geobacter sulfurreducens (strain ATCC 51573 / DSM 12127 / PCA) TaxID=243231 RepID=DNAA_GEOSL|nr:chromosomal replication initiator protein DnaA [Geobacter sulfurreducens]Q74GG6.1 RecName: Full=Chromosomal replication initiator protein DnaA [Geobacter sulfurreducens PCA]AAR99581.1 chromosomal replication initiator protein DnaA [Geobacter sulfurreducens PCA]ADI82864.1 chromosomal replication initiator protein DnaA [Geobacter sulfurreducens KN400]QVW35276.1 chromosomal replication initiator protein DnaA [Geobacter sulfurreducens]UAC04113.1 chromosomal replication initiator protein DnaA [G
MEEVWLQAQSNLAKVLTHQTFNTWIEPIKYLGSKKNVLLLEAPNQFVRDRVSESYLPMILESVQSLTDSQTKIELLIAKPKTEKPKQPAASEVTAAEPEACSGPDHSTNLNPKYTFDTFVCGGSNQFAHAAAQSVANSPAGKYNPLFIYGGVGLGKTHLLNAIGNHVLSVNRKARICFYTSEKFMNELINCLRYQKMDQFRNKFRKMDILLIDDIQFIAGKERTQEEFFHTFNSLYESHKQIVVTSDKFPKDIPGLEERLRSRFEWGLIADIQAPDTETKVAILRKKADADHISLPDDVALFLASSSTTNVRELEGMLIRLGAVSSLTGKNITLDMAREVLKDIIVDKSKEITVEMIQKFVAEHFSLKVADLKSDKRLKALVIPRQIAIFLCRDLTKSSYPEIGERFGGKDHSTIIHSVKKVEKLLSQDFELRNTVDTLRKGLLS